MIRTFAVRLRAPRPLLAAALTIAASGPTLATAGPVGASAQPAGPAAGAPCPANRWIEGWEAAPSDSNSVGDARLTPFMHGPNQTLRMIITPHDGGSATAGQIIAGLTQLVSMAKTAGIRVLLGTLTPMQNAAEPGTYSGVASNTTRLTVNTWIRTQQLAGGYIDFAAAVQDPTNPNTLAPAYDGGDGLHLTPDGYHAMANAINLSQLIGPTCRLGQLRYTVTPHTLTTGHRTRLRIRVTAPDGKPSRARRSRSGPATAGPTRPGGR